MSDRLAALVAEWRERIEALRRDGGWAARHRWDVYDVCASALEEVLSSAAPAPCPECGGKREVSESGTGLTGAWKVRVPCPCCSAQPAGSGDKVIWPDGEFCGAPTPSDVVLLSRGLVNKLAEAMDNFFPRLDHAGYHEQAEAAQQFAIELRAAALQHSADQPVPSDWVEVPRDVAREYVEASAAISDPIGDTEEELGLISDRFYAAQEALEQALAAALRQGGG